MTVKKVTQWIHRWLGLPAGLLVCVIALTGSLYVFKPDIEWLTQPYRRVSVRETALLPPSVLGENARAALPGKTLQTLKYTANGRSAEALFYAYHPPYYLSVFLDPYTGEVLKVHDHNKGFFAWVLDGHAYLWLKPSIGRPIVATATLVFVLLLLTCLVWGFQWFSEATYTLTGGTKALFAPTPTSAAPQNTAEPTFMSLNTALDRVFERMLNENPNTLVFAVWPH